MYKSWLVCREGTVSKWDGKSSVKMKNKPTLVHGSLANAEREAKRLSQQNPGYKFIIYEAKHAFECEPKEPEKYLFRQD